MENEKYKDYVKRIVFPCVLYAMIVGIAVGIVVFFFKFMANFLIENAKQIFIYVRNNLIFAPVFLLSLIFLGLLLATLQYLVPEVSGGGIPRSEGIARDLIVIKPNKLIIYTILGSFISFLAGLPLGPEGPSVIIGTSLGVKFNEMFKTRGHSWRLPVVSSGVASSFAIITGLPLTGIIFSMEEVQEKYSWSLILASSVGVIFASLIDTFLTKITKFNFVLIEFQGLFDLNLSLIWIPILIGIACGFLALVFYYTIKLFVYIFEEKIKIKNKKFYLYGLIFLLVGVIGLLMIETIGSGHSLINDLLKGTNILWSGLIVLLIYKIIMISLCLSSGATGGIFVPILTLGAIIGALLGKLLIAFGLNPIYFNTIIALSICAFLGSTLHCPLTAIVLILELTKVAYISAFFSLIAVFIALIIVSIFNIPSINQYILDRILVKEKNNLKIKKGNIEF
jgi:H+/Cl- antiporter ClcA